MQMEALAAAADMAAELAAIDPWFAHFDHGRLNLRWVRRRGDDGRVTFSAFVDALIARMDGHTTLVTYGRDMMDLRRDLNQAQEALRAAGLGVLPAPDQ